MSIGSPTAGTWSSSQWRPDNEFETDRRTERDQAGRVRADVRHGVARSASHPHAPAGSRSGAVVSPSRSRLSSSSSSFPRRAARGAAAAPPAGGRHRQPLPFITWRPCYRRAGRMGIREHRGSLCGGTPHVVGLSARRSCARSREPAATPAHSLSGSTAGTRAGSRAAPRRA